VFCDNRRKTEIQSPPALPDIKRVTVIKILALGVIPSLTTAKEHMRNVITSCAQTLYALKVLRAYVMNDSAVQSVYQAVII